MKYSGNCSILFLQEHLFDVSDLQDREPALISKCGTLEVIFNYSAIKAKMAVKIGVARDIPTKERGGASNVQVSQTIPIPDILQLMRCITKLPLCTSLI